MKYTIHTIQKSDGTWSCSVTIKQEDISFDGETMSLAQYEMLQYLGEHRIPRESRKWEAPVMYQPQDFENN